jgi:hypothetical protein
MGARRPVAHHVRACDPRCARGARVSTRLVLALLLTSLASVRPASAATSRAAAKPAPVAAAPAPTTAGRWNLIPAASVFGGSRKPPRARTDVISTRRPVGDGALGHVARGADSLVMDYRYRTDGEAVNKVMGRTSARWVVAKAARSSSIRRRACSCSR